MINGQVNLLQNFRNNYRGIRQHTNGRYEIDITDNEIQNYDFDLSGIMDTGETISTATITTESGSSASFIATITKNAQDINLKLENATASGNAYLLLTLSNGNVEQINLFINVTNKPNFEDYN